MPLLNGFEAKSCSAKFVLVSFVAATTAICAIALTKSFEAFFTYIFLEMRKYINKKRGKSDDKAPEGQIAAVSIFASFLTTFCFVLLMNFTLYWLIGYGC